MIIGNIAWSLSGRSKINRQERSNAGNCTTNLTYDTLNRLTHKGFSNCPSTPVIDYYYDGEGFSFNGVNYASSTNQNGYRTGMKVNGSNAAIWTYDPRGRVTGEQRMFIGAAFHANWTYNSADLPVIMTYPDGEEVSYEYNSRMLVETLTGSAAYVTGTTYDATGGSGFVAACFAKVLREDHRRAGNEEIASLRSQ